MTNQTQRVKVGQGQPKKSIKDQCNTNENLSSGEGYWNIINKRGWSSKKAASWLKKTNKGS